MKMKLHHQNLMLAVRQEMGWPAFAPANECISFCWGQPIDLENGIELARFAQMIGKDIVYSGWASTSCTEPTAFTVAYGEMLSVDIVDKLVPFAADDNATLLLVNTITDECFAIDRRESLARTPWKPMNVRTGRKIAMKRIQTAATNLGRKPRQNGRAVRHGELIEPETSTAAVVRFV